MNRKTFVLSIMTFALAFITSISAFAQNDVYNYTMVEEKPTFDGQDITQVPRWVYQNAKFPESIDLEQLKGKAAIISIIIGTEGKLTEAKVIKSISKEIDEILVNTLLDSEGWTPGKQRGKPVAVSAMIKIAFSKSISNPYGSDLKQKDVRQARECAAHSKKGQMILSDP